MANDIGLIGLAVMGQNLVLNMNDHGYHVAVFNRTSAKVDAFMEGPAKGTDVKGFHGLKEMFASLKTPRKVMMMVRAGQPIDDLIEECLPFMEKGDLLIDGGNSHFPDTARRQKYLESKGMLFLGVGVSGGEEGARHGPSMMPGGSKEGWPLVKDILQSIAAKSEGEPCCDWVGELGAGHYVKMVHNGIEYGDIQIICEAYQLMKEELGMSNDEMSDVMDTYNKGKLDSFLIEITRDILKYKEEGGSLVDKILDTAGQKGTGKWTAISALDQGVPVTLIGEAVFARCLSAIKEERVRMSKIYPHHYDKPKTDKAQCIDHLENALYAAKIISYVQGFMLMKKASEEMNMNLNYGSIALMWRGGCIIRSKFLGDIKKAFDKDKDLPTLLDDPFFEKAIKGSIEGLRKIVILATQAGVPVPCFSTALSFFDGITTERLPANLLQAQRDFFGAHTYERIDKKRGEFFHTNWTGKGGSQSSSTYNA